MIETFSRKYIYEIISNLFQIYRVLVCLSFSHVGVNLCQLRFQEILAFEIVSQKKVSHTFEEKNNFFLFLILVFFTKKVNFC